MADSTAWVPSSPGYAEGDELIPKAFIGLRKEGGRMPSFYHWPAGRRSTRPGAEPQATRRLSLCDPANRVLSILSRTPPAPHPHNASSADRGSIHQHPSRLPANMVLISKLINYLSVQGNPSHPVKSVAELLYEMWVLCVDCLPRGAEHWHCVHWAVFRSPY